jgi:iron(III) transport system permease protein
VTARRAPGLLWLIGVAAALLVALPLVYLVVRAAEGEGALAGGAVLVPLVARSAGLAITVGLVASALALVFAVLVEARDLPLRRVLSVALVVPLAVPCYVGATAYVAGLAPRGPFGRLLGAVGIGPVHPEGFGWAAFILVLYTVPFAYLPLRAALARTDGALVEVARTLGRGRWTALALALRTSLPRALVSGAVLVTLYTLGEFGAVALLGYDAFPRVIYLQFLSAFDRSAAAASALGLVGLIASVLLVARLLDRGHPRGTDRPRPLRVVLGPGVRWLALIPLVAYAVAAVIVPIGSIAWWAVRGGGAGLDAVLDALGTSALAAGLAIGPTLLVGVAVAILAERSPGGRSLARVVDLGFALPGLVVALGLTFVVLRAAPALHQGWLVYVAAMVILFCPLATAAVRGALAAVPPVLEDAARTLGADPLAVLRRVTLPVVWPGIAAGAALVAIATMKELSATLATRMWSSTEEARYGEAAPAALALVVLAGIAGIVAHRGRRA